MDYGKDKEDKEWRDVSAVGLVTKRRRGDGVGGRGFGQVAGDGMRRMDCEVWIHPSRCGEQDDGRESSLVMMKRCVLPSWLVRSPLAARWAWIRA